MRNRKVRQGIHRRTAMKRRLSRRNFIASAACSIVPSAIAYARPKGGGLLALLPDEPRPTKSLKGDWKNAGVIDLSTSPYAKLKTVPVRAVVIQDGFWDNFLRLEGKSSEPQKRASLFSCVAEAGGPA